MEEINKIYKECYFCKKEIKPRDGYYEKELFCSHHCSKANKEEWKIKLVIS